MNAKPSVSKAPLCLMPWLLQLLTGIAPAQTISNILVPTDPIIASSPDSPTSEAFENAIDGTDAKYLNFDGSTGPSGFIVVAGSTIVQGLGMESANNQGPGPGCRDPGIVTVEGSNDPNAIKGWTASTNWSLIYSNNTPSFIDRDEWQYFNFTNSLAFTTYRWTAVTVQGSPTVVNCMQIAEVQLLGNTVLTPTLALTESSNAGVLTISWTPPGGTLQCSPSLGAGAVWTTVGPANPATVISGPGTSFFRVVTDPAAPLGMTLIPAGVFTMGDTLDGASNALPTNIYVSAFSMDVTLVTYSQWQSVYEYATNAGYGFDDAGAGRAADQPVQSVNWYDVVKWSNARSQQAGLTPVYYVDALLTQVYTNGDTDAVYANWSANGYRLPTEAEWEKAARGGLSGQRFPWGDTISWNQANYYGEPGFIAYDFAAATSIDPAFNGPVPDTSPVGYFAANGYGLYDMAGNVFEWCWDWYGTPYGQPTGDNPTGPGASPLFNRVLRGGNWHDYAGAARCAYRCYSYSPHDYPNYVGFRCVRGY